MGGSGGAERDDWQRQKRPGEQHRRPDAWLQRAERRGVQGCEIRKAPEMETSTIEPGRASHWAQRRHNRGRGRDSPVASARGGAP